jgi:hypothetical protein
MVTRFSKKTVAALAASALASAGLVFASAQPAMAGDGSDRFVSGSTQASCTRILHNDIQLAQRSGETVVDSTGGCDRDGNRWYGAYEVE